ncbi:MAG TPA: ABC transporter substrate-binding protein [Methylomirabilota bacterium]|nr:ABC transporter substrate-binding protein [Methylomirabilota bacterium]
MVGVLCPVFCTFGGSTDVGSGQVFLGLLRERGYEDGRNIHVERRGAGVRYAQLPGYAGTLVRRNVDVILADGWAAADAARKATGTIPIVMAPVPDAVEVGLVAGLARPGGNVTGVTYPFAELAAKQLELLREAVPRLSRVAVLFNPDNPEHGRSLAGVEGAAQGMRLPLQRVAVRSRSELREAFASMARERVDGVLVLGDALLSGGETALWAIEHRIPVVSLRPDFVEAGGLLAYGPSHEEVARRVVAFIDRILKGAKPGDLPVEQPTKYDLIVNTATARALGLPLPPSLLLRGDRVIE